MYNRASHFGEWECIDSEIKFEIEPSLVWLKRAAASGMTNVVKTNKFLSLVIIVVDRNMTVV